MAETGFPGTYSTTTVTTATTVTTNIRFDPSYVRTIPGMLKIAVMVIFFESIVLLSIELPFDSATNPTVPTFLTGSEHFGLHLHYGVGSELPLAGQLVQLLRHGRILDNRNPLGILLVSRHRKTSLYSLDHGGEFSIVSDCSSSDQISARLLQHPIHFHFHRQTGNGLLRRLEFLLPDCLCRMRR